MASVLPFCRVVSNVMNWKASRDAYPQYQRYWWRFYSRTWSEQIVFERSMGKSSIVRDVYRIHQTQLMRALRL
jgi:hypothetical protein